MDQKHILDLIQRDNLYQQLVWDYSISPTGFAAMLDPKNTSPRDHLWALSRVVEHAGYYQTMQLIDKNHLTSVWPELRPRIRVKDIVTAYDFALSR